MGLPCSISMRDRSSRSSRESRTRRTELERLPHMLPRFHPSSWLYSTRRAPPARPSWSSRRMAPLSPSPFLSPPAARLDPAPLPLSALSRATTLNGRGEAFRGKRRRASGRASAISASSLAPLPVDILSMRAASGKSRIAASLQDGERGWSSRGHARLRGSTELASSESCPAPPDASEPAPPVTDTEGSLVQRTISSSSSTAAPEVPAIPWRTDPTRWQMRRLPPW
mmetsp:Transcript_30575/g.97605  ORF Transcript_30575/g.97605 Transcript_30575/m.97605 type:complete len:226 (+) Transcript_30575:369-1046(+)